MPQSTLGSSRGRSRSIPEPDRADWSASVLASNVVLTAADFAEGLRPVSTARQGRAPRGNHSPKTPRQGYQGFREEAPVKGIHVAMHTFRSPPVTGLPCSGQGASSSSCLSGRLPADLAVDTRAAAKGVRPPCVGPLWALRLRVCCRVFSRRLWAAGGAGAAWRQPGPATVALTSAAPWQGNGLGKREPAR
jgi:hypothetical protein